MNIKSLTEWLNWIQNLHTQEIDLGLERVRQVAERLHLLNITCPVITVAGTNGKGSCVAITEAIYLAAGYRVGAFTTPILFKHNEQVRINGVPATDNDFCAAFTQIAAHLEGMTLTPFEFNTLAAIMIFEHYELDVWILEVGLGGRLDAVNIVDADVAIVTSIDIDHADLLGGTRELIAREKAGIFRPGKPAICGDFSPPITLMDAATESETPLLFQNKDFGFHTEAGGWSWWSKNKNYWELFIPSLALQNAATSLMAIEILQDRLLVTREAIQQGLHNVSLPGRIEIFPGPVTRIFDVSHNPAAALFLTQRLTSLPCIGKTFAVFSMLADKDILSTLTIMKPYINEWHIAALPVQRGASLAVLEDYFRQVNITALHSHPSIPEAYHAAVGVAQPGDRVVIFGSFHTVAEAVAAPKRQPPRCFNPL